MKPEAQRIAIAEACGWTRVWDPAFRQWVQRSPDSVDVVCDPDPDAPWETHRLPDYLNDLNAMHEAEKVLTHKQKIKRVQKLCLICDRDYGGEVEPSDVLEPIEMASMFLDCTAAQRAEAFLRTLNLWED